MPGYTTRSLALLYKLLALTIRQSARLFSQLCLMRERRNACAPLHSRWLSRRRVQRGRQAPDAMLSRAGWRSARPVYRSLERGVRREQVLGLVSRQHATAAGTAAVRGWLQPLARLVGNGTLRMAPRIRVRTHGAKERLFGKRGRVIRVGRPEGQGGPDAEAKAVMFVLV